ncbi:MAG: site-specific integrase [Balneolaceae bacterium]|nr:site-specific integrase [Balneolaceae bacterium]
MNYSIYPFKRYGKNRLYVRFEDQIGNEVDRSTGVNYPLDATKKERQQAKKEAAQKAKQIIEEHHQQLEVPSPAPASSEKQVSHLATYLEQDYWPYVDANCEDSTLSRYQDSLDNFIRLCGDHPLDHYQMLHVERFKQQRVHEGVKKISVNVELRSIKAAFSWAYNYDIIDSFPFKGNGFLFDAEAHKRAFTQQEIQRLFDETEGETIGYIVRLAYYTGMRIGEVSKVTWKLVHLDTDKPFIQLTKRISKTSARSVPLAKKAIDAVKDLQIILQKKKQQNPAFYQNRPESECYLVQKTRGCGQYALRSLRDMFRRAMNRAGLPKELTFHCLRHSFATHVLEKGGDLFKVSKIMGHSNTQVTQQFYDHTTALNFRDTVDLL